MQKAYTFFHILYVLCFPQDQEQGMYCIEVSVQERLFSDSISENTTARSFGCTSLLMA